VSREAKEKSVLHWGHYPTHRRVCRLRSFRTRILILSGGRSHTFLVLIGKELARLVTRGSRVVLADIGKEQRPLS